MSPGAAVAAMGEAQTGASARSVSAGAGAGAAAAGSTGNNNNSNNTNTNTGAASGGPNPTANTNASLNPVMAGEVPSSRSLRLVLSLEGDPVNNSSFASIAAVGGGGGPGASSFRRGRQSPPPPPSPRYEHMAIGDKIERLIREANAVIFGRTSCPFTKDAVALLADNLCVLTHLVEANTIPEGGDILRYLKEKTEHPKSPYIFIQGKFLGGCEELYDLYNMGDLERETLICEGIEGNGTGMDTLITRQRALYGDTIETARLAPVYRGKACHAFFLFPCAVNSHVTRVTSLIVFALAVVGAAFFDRDWVVYLSTAVSIDALCRFLIGPCVSATSMLATLLVVMAHPNFIPGPAKQIDAFVSFMVSIFTTTFYYSRFDGHYTMACLGMVILALVAGAEGFFNLSLGTYLIELGLNVGLFPDHIYRMYNSTLLETVETYNYTFQKQHRRGHHRDRRGMVVAPDGATTGDEAGEVVIHKPKRINTDRDNPIALRYKRKSEEWVRADFDPIRHMHVSYLFCPLSIAGLSMAFRVSSNFRQFYDPSAPVRITVDHNWFATISCIAAFIFVFMMFMYVTKALLFFRKVRKDWDDPIHGQPAFAAISISFMLFGYLCYDQIFDGQSDKDTPAQVLGRVFFWIGSVSHVLLTVKVIGDWIGRSLDLEHVQPHWLVFPFGFGIAASFAPIVGPFAITNPNNIANATIADFYKSFGDLFWIVLFVITFYKVVTGHNANVSLRHGIWFWVSCPAVLGYSAYSICIAEYQALNRCADENEQYFFIALMLCFSILWASMPHISFLGRGDEFSMVYWIDCLAMDMLAVGAALFYLSNGWSFSGFLEFLFLTIAALSNLVALLHTCVCLIQKHIVAKPETKFDPLSFVKLMHDAMKANLPTVQYYLHAINLDEDSKAARDNLGLFAAHFNRFRIIQDEHLNHEERVVYKTCSEFFPWHGNKFIVDHRDDKSMVLEFCELVDVVLDSSRVSVRDRKDALERLRTEMPPFFSHLIRHFDGEEQNMDPIANKYFSIELKKQMARQVWEMTPADRWEVIIPFVLLNLPRHEERIRFLRSLLWSIPERAQQIGAIIYRNVDAVMWERLRVEVREMIPRGAPGWLRYY